MENTNLIPDGCVDIPDERDFCYDIYLAWNWNSLPEEFIIDDENDYQNQWLEEITWYGCVFYSTTHWVNILNDIENVWEANINAKEICLEAIQLGLLNPKAWAAIQSWPKLARDKKLIKGWMMVNEGNIKQAIYDWHPVVVWSNQFDFSKIILEPRVWGGHAIVLIGWNKDGFIIKESYGKERYDRGLQYLPYKYFYLLYPSKYALINEENVILTYKKKIMDWINIEEAKKAFEAWIWNGLNPTTPASREEVAAMIMRALEKLQK